MRYMDDMVILLSTKEECRIVMEKIKMDYIKALPFKTVETGPDGQPVVNDNELIVKIKELLEAGEITGYAGSLDNMPLTITYPDISKGEVLDIKNTWEVK